MMCGVDVDKKNNYFYVYVILISDISYLWDT
jgi:hypothetical protein